MVGVSIITSDRGVSLQKVAKDIGDVLTKSLKAKVDYIYYANVDMSLYKNSKHAIVVMTFDPAFVTPYFFLARELKVRGKKVLFYTTVEGRVKMLPWDYWVLRDLRFIANSKYTKEKLEDIGAKVDEVIYHGVDVKAIQSFSWKRKEIRASLGFKDDDFVVGYIAGGYMRKGHKLYAEVIDKVSEKDKSVKFVVVTDDNGKDAYEDVENVLVIPDFGKMPIDMLYGLYHSFDLYAQPSLSEGFGLPVLEALASGKPVVHADYPPLNEITTEETSFRVDVTAVDFRRELGAIEYELHYYNPDEFANAILYAKEVLLSDKDGYTSKCFERANEFDVKKVYKRFVELIKSGDKKHE